MATDTSPLVQNVVPLYVKRSDGVPYTTEEINATKAANAVTVGEPVGPDHKSSVHWACTLGLMLRSQFGFEDNKDNNIYVVALPKGYIMRSRHYEITEKHKRKDRSDVYVYGHPRGATECYRSPNEFAPHLIWLCTSSQERTECCCEPCEKIRKAKEKKDDKIKKLQSQQQGPSGGGPGPSSGPAPGPPGPAPGPAPGPPPGPPPGPAPGYFGPQYQGNGSDSSYGAQPYYGGGGYYTYQAAHSLSDPAKPITRNSEVFRQGEMVWYKTTAWRLGIISWIEEDKASNDVVSTGAKSKMQHFILPLAYASLNLQGVVKYAEDIRPFLTFSVPAVLLAPLKGKSYDQVDWPLFVKDFANGDRRKLEQAVLEASKLAALVVDASFSFFNLVVLVLAGRVRPEVESYEGIYLGGEQVRVGEAVRVKDINHKGSDSDSPGQILEVVAIMPESRPASHDIARSGVVLYGHIYDMELVSAAADPASIGAQPRCASLQEEIAYHNENDKKRAPGSRWVWRRVQTGELTYDINGEQTVARHEPDVLGRFYFTPKLLTIINPARLHEANMNGLAESAVAYLNNRMHGGGAVIGSDAASQYVGRKHSRLDTIKAFIGEGFETGRDIVEVN